MAGAGLPLMVTVAAEDEETLQQTKGIVASRLNRFAFDWAKG